MADAAGAAPPRHIAAEKRLPVLDGLRGIAILVVLWYHIWEWNWLNLDFHVFGLRINGQMIPETGFTGVDLFFFLSGFVLFYPYARHILEGAPLQTIRQFAYRRFIKIVPSYYLQLLILTPWIVAAFSGATLVKVYVTHLLFIHNWFRDTFGSVNGVLWTLAIEVQFYVLFPLLCWSFRRWPLATFAAMVAAANAYRSALAPCCLADYVIMTQLPAFLDLFACGMLGAWLFVWLKTALVAPERWQTLFTGAAMLGFIAYGVLLYRLYELRFAENWQWVWRLGHQSLLGAAFVIVAVGSLFAANWWRAILANRVFVFFAVISYNLYLWHQLIATFLAKHAFPLPRTASFATDRAWQWSYLAVTFVVSVGVSAIITYAFERPLLAKGFRAITDLFARPKPLTGRTT